jgi:uncharacterized protein (TIGR02569 family)
MSERPVHRQPSPSLLSSLGLKGEGAPLSGGQGSSLRYDNLVLKPCENPTEWTGLAPVLSSLDPVGYRIARPVQFPDGRWVVDGWMVTEVVEGAPGYTGREAEALQACDAIHRELRNAYDSRRRPGWLDHTGSCYGRADLVAWAEAEPREYLDQESCDLLENVTGHLRPLTDLASQITHGDPGGDNLLFCDNQPPAIIDFSPYWRPADYATAMMLADGIAWEGSAVTALELAADRVQIGQLLLRAVLFRLVVSVLYSRPSRLPTQLQAYDPVIRWAVDREQDR